MIPIALALYAGLTTCPAVDLDALTPADALLLDGHAVVATVTTDTPDVIGGWTVAGNDLGGLSRTVVVPADWRINSADVVRVVGVLETIRHSAVTVNGQRVPAWDEVRVTGFRVVKRGTNN